MRPLHTLLWLLLILWLPSCTQQTTRTVRLVVCNSNNYDVSGVVTGISVQAVLDSLHIKNTQTITLHDDQGNPVPTQLFDNGEQMLLLFECSVLAEGETAYTVQEGAPFTGQKLSIAQKMRQWFEEQKDDSTRQLLDVTLLGGSISPDASIRNPWNYQRSEVLSEGALLCGYRLHYDTLFINNDTLLEHRTLIMQKGTPLTIVITQFENAGRQDTLLLFHQLAVKVPCHTSDSLMFNTKQSYMAIQRPDNSALGLYALHSDEAEMITEPGHAGFHIPCHTDSTITLMVASPSMSDDTLSLSRTLAELQHLQDPALITRIVVQN